MISLQPREQFTIVRQLGDHTDPTTYYVRAFVRNSIDDTILKTINLTDKGGNRFKAIYEIPADISGFGFYIDITTSVYTDDTYAVKSTTYLDENETYLVFDRIVRPGGNGGGGADVDYKKIQKMITKAENDIIEAFPEMKETNLEPMMLALNEMSTAISKIKPEKADKVNLTPVIMAITTAQKAVIEAIANKEVTDPTDLSPVMDAIESKEVDLSSVVEPVQNLKTAIEKFIKEMNTMQASTDENAKGKLERLTSAVLPILSGNDGKVEKKKEVDTPEDNRAQRLLTTL